MAYRFRILGCGSSGGVPRIGNDWGNCDPSEPRNRRLRSSFLVEKWDSAALRDGSAADDNTLTRLLIDSSPDVRAQLLAANVGTLDGVAYTHNHADHTHGIDDLRVVFFNIKRRLPVYIDEVTAADLKGKFSYCFEQPLDANYVPVLEEFEIKAYQPFSVEGEGGVIDVKPFQQVHGNGHSLGFRFGNLAYCTDVNEFPDRSLSYLEGLDVLVLDALRYSSHPCHFRVADAVKLIDRYKPKRAILTHLHIDLDYQTLKAELPSYIEPAYDGMVIEME